MTDDETLIRVRAPRLTRLEIQGFKSFLHRTVFAFDPGITAIVGPNGSGKSNVADALRWVLGEQGQQALRARKTEDVIFSGGQGRAPAGMADVTLTFDNADGWLPSEFAEVSVTRRAFRSGESHYLINGRRVRLKDVAQLTAGLGQSHVVVGQGLVDAALSLRAEERRGMFEHAADLTGLRLKVAEAERNLAETEANTARLHDLLTELEPRLRGLERAARQAREWQGWRDRLRRLQSVHYRELLAQALAEHERAESELQDARSAIAGVTAEVERLGAAALRTGERLAAARAGLTDHDERRALLEDRLRRQTHERDLAAARLDSLARRRADMDDARAGLDERVAVVAADLVRLQRELRELERATIEAREAATRHHRDSATGREARADIEARLAEILRAISESEQRETDVRRQRAVLGERGDALRGETSRLDRAIAERMERIGALEADLAQAASLAGQDTVRAATLASELAALAAASAAASEAAATARAEADQLERDLGQLATRLDVLRKLQASGEGLHTGVRAVLQASRDGKLQGVRGTVAELLSVPAAIEVAIEVALGGRLQDVIVATWNDAEAAIAMLKRRGAGRATFQPLDTVRSTRLGPLDPAIASIAGVVGNAAALVSGATEIEAVILALLGRTVVVDDLATARAVLPRLAGGWSVVTVSGEIARTGGSVTGGAAIRESGTLSRERELRDLPTEVTELETRAMAARQRAGVTSTQLQAIEDRRRQMEHERSAMRAEAAERTRQADRLQAWLADQRGEHERSLKRHDELRADLEQVESSLAGIEHQLVELHERCQERNIERERLVAELSGLAAVASAAERAESEEGRRLAGLEERVRGERRREAGLRAQERALAEELALRAERLETIDRERQALTREHERLAAETTAAAEDLERHAGAREPLRMEAMGAEIAAGRIAESLQTARARLVEAERRHDRAGFALERSTLELDTVRRRIVEDLALANAEDVLGSEFAAADDPAPEREAEIGRLKERLRRTGYAGDDAVADYEREAAQQTHLREQLRDVEGASAALRELLAELRQTMRDRFDTTFAQVAAAFADAFAVLFGGGTARLVLTGGENGTEPGIDIVAQPPGKRLQGLALLSGGERALTAAALLFAILKVNPTPFCLLDEVDAALDEANVVRFRERLQELAAQTQVVVVTHNRGTIEIADSLYGVSMTTEGVSRVLSLRMSESLPAD